MRLKMESSLVPGHKSLRAGVCMPVLLNKSALPACQAVVLAVWCWGNSGRVGMSRARLLAGPDGGSQRLWPWCSFYNWEQRQTPLHWNLMLHLSWNVSSSGIRWHADIRKLQKQQTKHSHLFSRQLSACRTKAICISTEVRLLSVSLAGTSNTSVICFTISHMSDTFWQKDTFKRKKTVF